MYYLWKLLGIETSIGTALYKTLLLTCLRAKYLTLQAREE
jgi:hypothetical protein